MGPGVKVDPARVRGRVQGGANPLVHAGRRRRHHRGAQVGPPQDVAVGALELRIDADERLDPVVAGRHIRHVGDRRAEIGTVDRRRRPRRELLDVTPEERRAAHIMIKAEPDRAKAKAKVEALLAEIKKTPASFAELARKNSQDPVSAENEVMSPDREAVGVLIVDDQAPFRRAAKMVMAATPGFEVIGEAETGERAVELFEEPVLR